MLQPQYHRPISMARWARKLTAIDIDSRRIVPQVPVGQSPPGVWALDHAPRH